MELLGANQMKCAHGPTSSSVRRYVFHALGASPGCSATLIHRRVRAKNHVVSLKLRAVKKMAGIPRFRRCERRPSDPGLPPGDALRITYVKDLLPSQARLWGEPCMNMTNLHFHGLTVSPNAPQDDVIGMLAMHGQGLAILGKDSTRSSHGPCFGTTHHPHGESIGRCWMECQEPL